MVTGSRARAIVQVTADLVILTVRDDELQALLVRRGQEPFVGQLALPGGFLRDGESVEVTARRELAEETALDARRLHLEQLGTYSEPLRDPRGRVITVAFLAIAPDLPQPVAGSDASAATWLPVRLGRRLAFDHQLILRDGVERARAKLEYTTVAAGFCREPFTIADLRRVYEAVWGVSLDPGNFSRKVTRADGFLAPTHHKRQASSGRPAELYTRGRATDLHPPLLRPEGIRRGLRAARSAR